MQKTRMGEIKNGFHFLGVQFDATQTASEKSPATLGKIEIHPRSCRRALDKVRSMKEGAVPAEKIQSYLVRWSAWWVHTVRQLFVFDLLKAFVGFTERHDPKLRWLGSGLLMWSIELRLF